MRCVPSFLRPFSVRFATLLVFALLAPGMAIAQLPNAPSALLAPDVAVSDSVDFGSPAPQRAPMSVTLPIVNGRPYRPPTARENFLSFRSDLIGIRPFLSAGIRSGIEEARTVPTGWGQDFPGYLQRYGSAYGEAAINNSVRYGLGAAFHEDVRYRICHKCSIGDKFENAVLSEFTARHGQDGHRTFSVTPIIANFSGPLVAYSAWYPPGYGPDDAAKHSALGFGTRIVFRMVRELVMDRDTPAEKAAAKRSAADAVASPPPAQ